MFWSKKSKTDTSIASKKLIYSSARNRKADEKREKATLTDQLMSIDPRNTGDETFILDHHLGNVLLDH